MRTFLLLFLIIFNCHKISFAVEEKILLKQYPDLIFDLKNNFWNFDERKQETDYWKTIDKFLLIRTEIIKNPLDAKKTLKNKLVQLRLLYSSQTAAYPGMLTKDESCLKVAKIPSQILEGKSYISWMAEMPATKNFVYGTCGSTEEPYQSQFKLLYCKKTSKLYEIKLFIPAQVKDLKSQFDVNCTK